MAPTDFNKNLLFISAISNFVNDPLLQCGDHSGSSYYPHPPSQSQCRILLNAVVMNFPLAFHNVVMNLIKLLVGMLENRWRCYNATGHNG